MGLKLIKLEISCLTGILNALEEKLELRKLLIVKRIFADLKLLGTDFIIIDI